MHEPIDERASPDLIAEDLAPLHVPLGGGQDRGGVLVTRVDERCLDLRDVGALVAAVARAAWGRSGPLSWRERRYFKGGGVVLEMTRTSPKSKDKANMSRGGRPAHCA